MLPGRSRKCALSSAGLVPPKLNVHSRCTDPAQHVLMAAIGSTVDYLDDLDCHLSEVADRVSPSPPPRARTHPLSRIMLLARFSIPWVAPWSA